jgi:hypothetical protein
MQFHNSLLWLAIISGPTSCQEDQYFYGSNCDSGLFSRNDPGLTKTAASNIVLTVLQAIGWAGSALLPLLFYLVVLTCAS